MRAMILTLGSHTFRMHAQTLKIYNLQLIEEVSWCGMQPQEDRVKTLCIKFKENAK